MKAGIPQTPKQILINTVLWGFLLWLMGYMLGFLFFAFIPQALIGWYILPIGTAVTLWILMSKIERKSFQCYIGVGVIWTLIAIIFDYVFIVKLLNSSSYYKLDVYIYYLLTFSLPIIIGWYKFHKITNFYFV